MRTQDDNLYDFSLEEDWSFDSFSYFKVDEEATEKIPCVIEGLNTGEGVKNAGGKLAQYVEVLRLFGIESTVLAQNLESYYSYNRNMFLIKIHGLKNSCSCIGSEELSDKARKLMESAIDGKNIKSELDAFTVEILNLIENIKAYIEEVRQASKKTDEEDKRAICLIPGIAREKAAEMHEAIRNLDLETFATVLEEVRTKKYNPDIEMYLDRLTDLCNQYDFDEALQVLEKITEPF